MLTLVTPSEMRSWSEAARRDGHRIAFVPTMGALHAGHQALLKIARKQGDRLVASIFVNPTQFGPHEDFARYPRQPECDAKICADEGVDVLFCPRGKDMYAADHSVYVVEGCLTRGLCGPFRPGHFRGVLTVVTQFFNLVQPEVAIFGQKDAQQCRLIQCLVRDLHLPVCVRIAPTVREPDGLAMSSRNQYLAPAERQRARILSEALGLAEEQYRHGERDAARACSLVRAHCLAGHPAVSIEYVEAVDFGRLEPVSVLADGVLVALSVRLGRTRLIDNVLLGRERVAETFGLL